MNLNIWIDKNKENLDYTFNIILNFLNNYKNKFNYDINSSISIELIKYMYKKSSNINDSI